MEGTVMGMPHDIKAISVMAGKTLLTTAILAIVVLSALPFPGVMQSIPCTVTGHATVGGSVASGVTVSLSDGQSKTADSNGYFQFTVNNGSPYTLTASYGGHSASKGFTATGALMQVDINVDNAQSSAANPSAQTTAPTPSPTAQSDRGIISFDGSSRSVEDEGNVSLTVVRSGGANGSITVDYATIDGTAIAGMNYVSASGTLTFADGETSKIILINVLKGDETGRNLTFTIVLRNLTGGASLGKPDTLTTTISHGYINGVFNIGAVSYNVSSAEAILSVQVSRLEGSKGNVTVEYQTVDGSAMAGINYVPMNGVLAFTDGETSKYLNLTIINGNMTADTASFTIILKNATGGAYIGPISTAKIVIRQATDVPSTLLSIINKAGSVVSSGNSGKGGQTYVSSQQIVEKSLRLVAAVIIGTLISAISIFWVQIWEFLLRLLGPLREIALGYTEEVLFHVHVRTRKVQAVTRKPIILGISMGEILTILFSMVLLGLAFSYAEEHRLNLSIFLFVGLVAGVTIIAIQIASRIFANHYKMIAEFKFWDIGALALIITTLFVSIPFARPAMVVVKEEGEEIHGEHENKEAKLEDANAEKGALAENPLAVAILAISSPYTGLVLSIVFLLFILYGGLLGEIGISGIKISALLSSYTLLPFKPMEGRNIFKWNKLIWAMMFVPSILLYLMVGLVLE
jgi:Zn-dependent protease